MDTKMIAKICSEIESKDGEGTVFQMGTEKSKLKIPRWSTGIEDLDEVLGGGMPMGRVVEIFGPESSGKTTLAYWLMSRVKLGVYDPIEGTYDESRAKAMGVKEKRMIVVRSDYGEHAMNTVMRFSKAGIPLAIIDSVPACQPKDEIEKLEKDATNNPAIGGVARLFSRMLPVIVRRIEATGTTLILINQVRDKMNAMMFGEKDDTPGGRAIKFYSSVRMKVMRKAWIEIPNKNPRITAENVKIGFIMKVKVVKSKICNPFGECEIPFLFDRGPISFDELKSIRQEIMKANRNKKQVEEEDDDE
jgi:recombination protein RecA